MRKDGSCDTRILESAIGKINQECQDDVARNRPIIVIKSTIPPGTTERLGKIGSVLQICFSPEFLTEANSFEDFKNQSKNYSGRPETSYWESQANVSKSISHNSHC